MPSSIRLTSILLLLAAPALVLANPAAKPAAPAAKPAAPAASPAPPAAASSPAKPAKAPASDEAKLHALGVVTSEAIRTLQLSPAELEIVRRGFAEALASPKTPELGVADEELQTFLRQKVAAAATVNKEAGKTFLAKAAAEKGAQKTASGVVYRSLKEGTGATPKPTDTVKVSVTGMLTDGTEFDRVAEGTEFPLSRVIPCLAEGIAKMKPSGKARIVCPSDTAYGDQGRPPAIPPGATLVFEVALVSAAPTPAMGMPGGRAMPPGHPPMGGGK